MTHATYDTGTRLGDLIRTQRRQQGLTGSGLARQSGLAPSTLRAVEAGDVDPRLSTVRKIAVALGHDLSDLLRYAGH